MMHTPNHRAILSTARPYPTPLGKRPAVVSPARKPNSIEHTDAADTDANETPETPCSRDGDKDGPDAQ